MMYQVLSLSTKLLSKLGYVSIASVLVIGISSNMSAMERPGKKSIIGEVRERLETIKRQEESVLAFAAKCQEIGDKFIEKATHGTIGVDNRAEVRAEIEKCAREFIDEVLCPEGSVFLISLENARSVITKSAEEAIKRILVWQNDILIARYIERFNVEIQVLKQAIKNEVPNINCAYKLCGIYDEIQRRAKEYVDAIKNTGIDFATQSNIEVRIMAEAEKHKKAMKSIIDNKKESIAKYCSDNFAAECRNMLNETFYGSLKKEQFNQRIKELVDRMLGSDVFKKIDEPITQAVSTEQGTSPTGEVGHDFYQYEDFNWDDGDMGK